MHVPPLSSSGTVSQPMASPQRWDSSSSELAPDFRPSLTSSPASSLPWRNSIPISLYCSSRLRTPAKAPGPFYLLCTRSISTDGWTPPSSQPSLLRLHIGHGRAPKTGSITRICGEHGRYPNVSFPDFDFRTEQSFASRAENIPAEFQYPRGFLNQIPSGPNSRVLFQRHTVRAYEMGLHGESERHTPTGCTNQTDG